jgi:hypothetical protein
MDGHELAEVVGAAGIFAFLTTIVTVVIVQVFTTLRARAALAREAEFRRLAENTERRLADLAEQVAAVHRILKQVE